MKRIVRGIFHRQSDGRVFAYSCIIHEGHGAFSAKIFDSRANLVGAPLKFLQICPITIDAQCKRWIEDYIDNELQEHIRLADEHQDQPNIRSNYPVNSKTNEKGDFPMKIAPLPPDEKDRLRALRELLLLDTEPEERFDRITRFAKDEFGVPIALVTLVDEERQWSKSNFGLSDPETHRDVAFCSHTILEPDHLVVDDTLLDKRFADNPLVTGKTGLRFYAGAPLRLPSGHSVGSLCILDTRPRMMDEIDLSILKSLRDLVVEELVRREGS